MASNMKPNCHNRPEYVAAYQAEMAGRSVIIQNRLSKMADGCVQWSVSGAVRKGLIHPSACAGCRWHPQGEHKPRWLPVWWRCARSSMAIRPTLCDSQARPQHRTRNAQRLSERRTEDESWPQWKRGSRMVIDELLEMWAAWQERYSLRLGHKAKSVGFATGGINCWDDLESSVSDWTCEAIDASVRQLSINHPSQAAAVHRQYLGTSWRFPRDNFTDMLEAGKRWLEVDLEKRNVVIEA